MFNGYNDTPLISYEFNQERVEKKHESVPKWPGYGHDAGLQPAQTQPNNRHPEFWTGKSNFLGIPPNVVKCNCTGCYPEKQSYQGDTTRHRPWLPRTFPVPVNGSKEPCKLPSCQWDNVLSNQGSCYPESGLPYAQENGGKYPYYKHHQRLAESNQPGVITSVKNAEYAKKSKTEIGQDSPVQNGTRQPVFCNPAYSLAKRVDGRNYCEAIEKYSNVASYSVDQHIPRLPVVEPFTKAVPSNLSQSRVPSTGYRSVKENMPQSYVDLGFGDARKMCQEEVSCEQRSETFPSGQLQTGVHTGDFTPFNSEVESQKLFLDNTRHPDYYSRNNFQDVIKRNNQSLDTRKDCAMLQINEAIMSEQHYNIPRSKQEDVVNAKTSCDLFYTKEFDKTRPESHPPGNPVCFQRNEDGKNESMNVHARLPPSGVLFNDPRFADRNQNSLTCQSNPAPYRNYIRPEYPYQSYSTPQARYEYPAGFQRNDVGQYRTPPQQIQACQQLPLQQGTGFVSHPHYQLNPEKTQQIYRGKNPSPIQAESQTLESRNQPYLEAIRSDELTKNGTSKISPLRLLRKKKFINVPQEPAPASTLDALPGLDVRKFWSTWAEEEEENVAPAQVVVLDCQNIDPEQAKLLHLYDGDPLRSVHLETNNSVIKNADSVKESVNQTVEEVKTCDEVPKVEEQQETPKDKTETTQQDETNKTDESDSVVVSEPECPKSEGAESVCQKTTSGKPLKKMKSENRGKKKPEIMDKWTEKKFDFLKRAEESKAAEILRHEEEKKKIFETRLSLQQSWKKSEKAQEKTARKEDDPERLSPFDENSQSDSPEDVNENAENLPTCEYRRNKFLDYSDRKVILNGEEKTSEDERTQLPVEVKKEENQKVEDKWPEKFFPPLNPKVKEEAGVEMEDILKKMSEINFQNPEIKLENGLERGSLRKAKSARKFKKRKSDHPPETEERTDKLTVETVTKPTIKFSIQKSHDLKISFKVLNSSKEYSDEERGGEDAGDGGKAGDEDSKNATELITLKYKSIKREGDRRQLSELKKCRKAFRRKKQTPKTPVLKIKKSRYMPQEERDPLADDEYDEDTSDKCLAPDGFEVKETMDSAKIKLTFKRHKGNFETEYKINNIEKVSEGDATEIDDDAETTEDRCRKKSRIGRCNQEIFAEPGVENFQNYEEPDSSEQTNFESILEDDSRNSSTSRDSYTKDDGCEFRSGPYSELRSGDPQLAGGTTPEKELHEEGSTVCPGETQNRDVSEWSEEVRSFDQDPVVEFGLGQGDNSAEETADGNGDEFPQLDGSPCPDENVKQSTPAEVKSVGEGEGNTKSFEKEENEEISLDFIRSTKSQEIELRHNLGKTVEGESVNVGNGEEELKETQLESGIPETEDGSWTSSSAEVGEVNFTSPKITDEMRASTDESERSSALPSLDLEEENCMKSPNIIPEKTDNEESTEALKPLEEEITSENGYLAIPDENPSPALNANSDTNNSFENVEKVSSPPTSPENASESVESFQSKPAGELPEDDVRDPLEFVLEKSTEHGEKNAFECGYFGPTAVTEDSFFENSDPSLKNDLESTENSTGEDGKAFPPTVDSSVEITFQPSSDWDTQVEAQVHPEPCRTSPETLKETPPENSNYPSANAEPSKTDKHREEYTGEDEEDGMNKHEDLENVLPSPENNELPSSPTRSDSVSPEVVSSSENTGRPREENNNEVKNKCSNAELEDGEIVDSPGESQDSIPENEQKSTIRIREKVNFVARKIDRRHSIKPEKSTWSRKKFSKAKSCPPQLTFTELLVPEQEMPLHIPVENIPLPLGPPPCESCFDFVKYMSQTRTHSPLAKDKPKESTSPERQQKEETPPKSPPSVTSGEEPSQPGILQRSSKIKFSFLKRSKYSKIGVKSVQDKKPEVQDEVKVPVTKEKEVLDSESKERIVPIERDSIPKECQIEKLPKANLPDGMTEGKSVGKCRNEAEAVDMSCEDLEDSVAVIDTMADFIRDEFYECQDIPTSEDLTNGEDPEIEKVNDDKFRNIMQNCLDNAKKFLNVGNLKLFSCSVDDLLELDCQEGSDSCLGENEPEKPANHISRDVLLTSCDDANEELGLSNGDVQPSDISMDFVPSFCSDVCPEILPVDNWPYLEEEVPSSPTKTKAEETDLVPILENVLSCNGVDGSFSHRNGTERRRRKRVASESSFNRFRRKSLLTDGEALRMCSKIGVQRRKTIESFTCVPEIKDEMKNDAQGNSLKCRLSLDKITNRHGVGFRDKSKDPENGGKVKGLDYRSPLWQPKVMLFRISKNELRKVLKSSKTQRRFESKSSDESAKRKVPSDLANKVSQGIKKLKSDPDGESVYLKQEFEEVTEAPDKKKEERVIDLTRLDSIKGSVMSADPRTRKHKKSRFRNLHTKRKIETDAAKDINLSAPSIAPAEPALETAFAEIFKDCDRLSDPQNKNTSTSIKDDEHRSRRKSEQGVATSCVEVNFKSERISQNETETTRKPREEWKRDKHRERKHDHRDRRSEKREGREHGESGSRKNSRSGSSHESSRHQEKRSPGGSSHSRKEHEPKRYAGEGVEKKWKHQREATPEASWVCEVCGFNDASERVVHIKSHPFHCQSCHLAFKTESHFTRHLTKKHKDIRNQHHCLLCELSFDTEDQYQSHLETREHRHLESVEKNTINTLFTLLTGAPCPVFGLVEMRPEWLPNQAGTVHFYHQATPLSLALQYLKMHHDLSSFSTTQSSAHPK